MLHVLNGSDDFTTRIVLGPTIGDSGTGSNWSFELGDHNGDGREDLYAIKRAKTRRKRDQIHILNGADDYKTWLLHSITALDESSGDDSAVFLIDHLDIPRPPKPLPNDGILCGQSSVFRKTIESGQDEMSMRAIGRLYCGLLDRAPDPNGFKWFVDRYSVDTLGGVAQALIQSAEFSLRYGTLSDLQFVRLLYVLAFDRTPNNQEQTYWLNMLGGGAVRSRVAVDILSTPAAKTNLDPFFQFLSPKISFEEVGRMIALAAEEKVRSLETRRELLRFRSENRDSFSGAASMRLDGFLGLRTLWVWEADTYSILMDVEERQAMIQSLVEKSVGRVFLYADLNRTGEDMLAKHSILYRDTINAFHVAGIEVYALLGADQEIILKPHAVQMALFARILDYNRAHPESAFDGVNTDYEPDGLIQHGWQTPSPRGRINVATLRLMTAVVDMHLTWKKQREAAGQDLPIGPSIPHWWHFRFEWAPEGEPVVDQEAFKHIFDVSDYCAGMFYRDRAFAPESDGIVGISQTEMLWAAEKKFPLLIGIETDEVGGDAENTMVTFYEEGAVFMAQELEKVVGQFSQLSSWASFALHHAGSFLTMSEGPRPKGQSGATVPDALFEDFEAHGHPIATTATPKPGGWGRYGAATASDFVFAAASPPPGRVSARYRVSWLLGNFGAFFHEFENPVALHGGRIVRVQARAQRAGTSSLVQGGPQLRVQLVDEIGAVWETRAQSLTSTNQEFVFDLGESLVHVDGKPRQLQDSLQNIQRLVFFLTPGDRTDASEIVDFDNIVFDTKNP